MRDNVSIRNIKLQTARLPTSFRKSEAITRGDAARLLPLWPRERDDRSLEGRKKLIAALERALREERRRGRMGHKAYDLGRHAALSSLLKKERAALAAANASCRKCVRR